MTKTYWWTQRDNFGDRLNAELLWHFAGITAEWSPPQEAELVACGSLLDVLPAGWSGVVAGAGKLHSHTAPDLSGATVLGVRGKLTARGLGLVNPVLGDPGLLADELVSVERRSLDLGVVPHWTDKDLAKRFAHLNPTVIDPSGNPLDVVAQIGRCKKIVSSSLHGIVVADAFGIPRRAERFKAMDTPYEGGTFKFEDYSSGIDFPIKFGVLQHPDRERIEKVQQQLFQMFERLGEIFNG